ncbi:glycoside hydrolase family 2 TIM barrel-domain containing protein [Caulobacter sp. 1776]|uniref:glycoside hydrolase family 2 protein n=1 Tax=Caulobacter sp. 1776 TaxID=3156420 RepID=UPI00339AEB07
MSFSHLVRRVGAALVLAAVCLAAPVSAAPRQVWPLDAGWRFLKADAPEAAKTDYEDQGWASIALPHTFNAADGADGGGYYRGPAWYRRTLDAPAPKAGERSYLEFDGAALVADVWVNGRLVGRHEGGYARFRFDVTDALRPGANVLAVRVDNSASKTVAPLGGDFTVFGGLYRSVRLVRTADLHLDMLDYGGPGAYARAEGGRVKLTARVRNDRAQAARLDVTARLNDAAGKIVLRLRTQVVVRPGETAPVTLSGVVNRPRSWDGRRDPYLYRLTTSVVEGGRVRDAVTTPLGFRTLTLDPARGARLNGRPIGLHGVNLFHSGRPDRGLAVSDADIDEDFAILRELGATALRFVHFQHPQRAYDDADRDGFLVWTEIPLNSAVDPDPGFTENLVQQTRELIRQTYNHPSVFVWGLGNEIYKSDETSQRVLSAVQAAAREADPSRPTVYAHCCGPDTAPHTRVTDVIAFNKYFGWYPDQVGEIGDWADRAHAAAPGRAMAVSEYGAGASILHQEDPPARPKPNGRWHPEQYQALFHENAWRQLRARPYLWAQFVWVGFDLASDGRDEGDRPGINDKGLATYDRKTRKDAYYWYKANWSDAPMAYVTSRRFTERTSPTVDVKVYSNLKSLRLVLDGADLGERPVVDHVALWPAITLREGVNRLTIADRDAVRDTVAWTYRPSR